ncbi:hypothetical protein DPMN_183727 [Dreissena polymorpha]|jgi:hypothetical protein|uniref:Uncharacterized protein n=1 Tax=Dreissena polymorpha TaxID=45954 RepID=A0A9D4DH57_DREPO|nr:hypothetical protein DPMN_183727 [Dreissena polymorpha]
MRENIYCVLKVQEVHNDTPTVAWRESSKAVGSLDYWTVRYLELFVKKLTYDIKTVFISLFTYSTKYEVISSAPCLDVNGFVLKQF